MFFRWWGASFLSAGGGGGVGWGGGGVGWWGVPDGEGIGFYGGVSKKLLDGGHPPCPPTMGNPDL